MEYNQIEFDFISRTKKLLEEYQRQYEVTMLVNCCIGLLVLPKEKHLNSIPDLSFDENKNIWGLSKSSISVDCEQCGYKLRDVIRRIRNGICHFNISSIPNESKEIEKLEIKDRGRFRVTLTVEQLRELSISIANHILDN